MPAAAIGSERLATSAWAASLRVGLVRNLLAATSRSYLAHFSVTAGAMAIAADGEPKRVEPMTGIGRLICGRATAGRIGRPGGPRYGVFARPHRGTRGDAGKCLEKKGDLRPGPADD